MYSEILRRLLSIFSILPLIVAIFILARLPTRIPIHWNSLGIVDRYGNKYILLIMPLIAFFCWNIFLLYKKVFYLMKKKYMLFFLGTEIFFNAIFLFIVFVTFQAVAGKANSVYIFPFLFIILGLFIIFIGIQILNIPVELLSIPDFLLASLNKNLLPYLLGYFFIFCGVILTVVSWYMTSQYLGIFILFFLGLLFVGTIIIFLLCMILS